LLELGLVLDGAFELTQHGVVTNNWSLDNSSVCVAISLLEISESENAVSKVVDALIGPLRHLNYD
jgi:hypothetical protein